MAKFYLQGIPETPAVSTQPQAAQVAPVKGGPAQFGTIDARVQNIDIAKNIPSLMQRGLPEDLSNALVSGPLRVGAAWAGAAESLGNLADTAGKIAAHLQHSKDVSDRSRYKNLIELNDAAFNEEVATKNLNAMEALELSQSYHERLDANIGSLGLSRENLEQAGVDVQLYKSKHRTNLTNGMREEQIKSDTTAIDTRIQQSVSKGDIDGAMDALEDGMDAKIFNPGQYEQRKQAIKVGYDEWKVQQDIGTNPRAAYETLDHIARTGENNAYPNLQPGQIHDLRNRAYGEVNRRENEAYNTILDGIAGGTLKTPQDIDNAAGGNLGATEVADLKAKQAAPGPAYSSEAMAKIETAIDNYVKEPADTGSPAYRGILNMIMEGAPKDQWTDLKERLNKKRDAAKSDLPGKDWFPDLLNEFTQMTEDGRFIPTTAGWFGTTPKEFDRDNMKDPDWRIKPENKAKLDAMWDRTRSMQIIMREWRQKNPGNDEKTIIEARKLQNELLKNADSQAGLDAVRKATQTQLPTTPPTTSSTGPRQSFFVTDEEMAASGGRGPNYPAAPATLNESLISSVKQLEGFEPVSKWDYAQYSVGYGTRGSKGERLTEEQAHDRLVTELESHASNIDNAAREVGLSLTENERNALISFDFNTGKGDHLITSSGGDKAEILRRLQLYIKAGGKRNEGLVNRRRAEARMFQGLA